MSLQRSIPQSATVGAFPATAEGCAIDATARLQAAHAAPSPADVATFDLVAKKTPAPSAGAKSCRLAASHPGALPGPIPSGVASGDALPGLDWKDRCAALTRDAEGTLRRQIANTLQLEHRMPQAATGFRAALAGSPGDQRTARPPTASHNVREGVPQDGVRAKVTRSCPAMSRALPAATKP
jgi:hypothetical protein